MKYPVAVTVNGRLYREEVEARTLLVHFLRDELGFTGTHVGCDTSQCGSCLVACDGHLLKSCTRLAVQADGAEITTIEGLAEQDSFGRLARRLLEGCTLQCGFCAPGVVLVAQELVKSKPRATDEEIRRALEGVLCQCGAYQCIVEAIRDCLGRPGEPGASLAAVEGSAVQRSTVPGSTVPGSEST